MTTVYDIFELRAYAVKVYGRGDDQHIGICHLVIYLFHTVFLKALVAFSCKTSVATDTRRDFFVAHRYYFDVVVFVCAVRKRLCQYIGLLLQSRYLKISSLVDKNATAHAVALDLSFYLRFFQCVKLL